MNQLGHTDTVSLDPRDVDFNDRTYLIPCFQDMGPLVASIERVGILNPPLLERSAGSTLRPILGRRRILAATSIGLTSIPARVFNEPVSETDGFLLAFWDNIGHRAFDTATTAAVVRRLLELLPRQEVADDYLSVLGIPPRGPKIQRMETLGSLEDTVLEAVANGSLLAKTALILARLDRDDRSALVELVKGLGLNANKSAEVIDHLVDLSVLQGRGVRDFLNCSDAQAILLGKDLPTTERANRFRMLVRTWKFPELVEKEREFQEWLDSQPRLDRVTVRPTQAFEDEKCTISVAARSRSEAKEILASLAADVPKESDPDLTDFRNEKGHNDA